MIPSEQFQLQSRSSSLSACIKGEVNRVLFDRYRCPDFDNASSPGPLLSAPSYFRSGRYSWEHRASSGRSGDTDLNPDVTAHQGRLSPPFDLVQAIENLRYERYAHAENAFSAANQNGLLRRLYYSTRPLLPLKFRSVLQRIYLRGWNRISFPSWPVDVTVENLIEKVLLFSMKAAGLTTIPFIWFWPDGASSATIMTHDIETTAGRDFCGSLMDIDESFGFRSSFQVVPEERYRVPPDFLSAIRARGHCINVQDLNHDGQLFSDRLQFCSRVKLINEYGRKFGAKGFRSAVLYRNLNWYDQLEFEYDMSVPNVGHLDAQRGGCCTVFPYFIGHILELPVTTTQDYSLFHILRDYSLDLWMAQASGVEAKHGLLSFIVHPDYLSDNRSQKTYHALLAYLRQRSRERGMWIATSDAVNRWWRQRSQMRLVSRDGTWLIDGPGKERAGIGYARIDGDRIVYTQPS